MVAALNERKSPFGLVVTGEAESWRDVLGRIVGPQWLVTYKVNSGGELLEVVREGLADAAVLDDSARFELEVLQLLRMIRRLDAVLPVVVVTAHTERRWLEDALRLAAFSVVTRPLELEELLRQIQRMMVRLDQMLREEP
ncbi:MAG: response regulator [Phycisphaerae bacterium]